MKPLPAFALCVLAPLLALSAANAQMGNLPPAPARPAPVTAALVDREATPEPRALMARLAADYGRRSWSALQLTNDLAYIRTNADRRPAIISGDFMDYSPSRIAYGAKAHLTVEALIALAQAQARRPKLRSPADAPAPPSRSPGSAGYLI